MADKNYSLKVDLEAESESLHLAVVRLENIQKLKNDIAGKVDLVSDNDIKKIVELGKSIDQAVVAEKKQKEVVDEHTKALEKLVKAQAAEAIELEQLKVLTQQQNKENKEAAKEALGLTTEYEKQSKQLAELKKEAKSLLLENRALTKSEQELVKATQELDAKLKQVDKSVGDNQRHVGDYRGQLKLLQKEMQGLDPGTTKFNEAAKRAGELKGRINDAADATKAFASGSKSRVAKNLFSQIGNDLKDLDFAGAADKARTFAAVMKSITFGEVISGLKNFGSTLSNVAAGLLSNPFTILLTAAVALGAGLYQLNKAFSDNEEAIKLTKDAVDDLKKSYDKLSDAADAAALNRLKVEGKINDFQQQRIKLQEKFQSDIEKLEKDRADFAIKLEEEIGVESTRQIDVKKKRRKELNERLAEFDKAQAGHALQSNYPFPNFSQHPSSVSKTLHPACA